MKKLLTGLLAMFMGLTVTMAQTPATAKKEVKSAKAKTEKTTAAPAAAATTKTKKDGTPDKRYKENKAAATPAGPTKKDGTPDMRYKSNNKNAGKKKA
ncbi:hypothetical protein [Chitinophaga polysaccharea]|uniref:hypothetical protein n=1 Tax=Chitinophaga polysaccharea TaxID=1293035 RepID=UPI00115ADF46|nr:hypothetical protein [Chitinophaga polysaccharea]